MFVLICWVTVAVSSACIITGIFILFFVIKVVQSLYLITWIFLFDNSVLKRYITTQIQLQVFKFNPCLCWYIKGRVSIRETEQDTTFQTS